MNIYTHGLGLNGRFELHDPAVDILSERHRSVKRVYFVANFKNERRHRSDCFMITPDEQLNWILEDTEILERHLYSDPSETGLLQRALAILENEQPLNQEAFSDQDRLILRSLNLSTLRPGVVISETPTDADLHQNVRNLHHAIGRLFFYTAGKSETRVWDVGNGATISEAAGQIHSDLERGFIRAEVFNVKTIDQFRTLQEAKTMGLLSIVDRGYHISAGDVIDVKFNV